MTLVDQLHVQKIYDSKDIQICTLTHFRPMFHLWINQVVCFTSKMFEKHLWKSDILSKHAGHHDVTISEADGIVLNKKS